MPCFRCGRLQTDPVKGKSPWVRLVQKGEQVLLCPECQRELPDWPEHADHCPECGSARLAVVMGSVVCRQCGRDFDRSAFA